jgi:tetratricopeptide (TPR) repeat protein
MRDASPFTRRAVLPLALVLAGLSVGTSGQSPAPAGVVQQVRVALGHGGLTSARAIANGDSGPEAARELARALVEVFEGRDDAARTRLQPLAGAAPLGDAAVELGLLDIRRGRIEEGEKRLAPIVANRKFDGPDDYLRIARAARAMREYQLANDAFKRVAKVARPDIHTEWGDLFMVFHQNDEAATSYRDAIAADALWVPAHLGLARAFGNDDPAAAGAALEAARKIAPDHPDLWLIEAERRLVENDLNAAKEALDRVAAVRPGSLEEAALRVGVAYLEGGVEAVEPAIARVREANPRSALGYRRGGEQAAYKYRFDDAAALAAKAVALDAQDPAAHFDLGLYLMRTGDEAGARKALERSWELDRSAPMTKNLLDLLDVVDKFEVVKTGDLVFKLAPDEAAVLKPYALPLAEEAYKTFVNRYGFAPKGPILIEIFPVHDDFAVRTLGLPGLVGALGACFGRVVTMDSPRARDPGEFSWQATLWHEMAHVFSLQLSNYRVPRWLTEGISVFEEHRKQPAWGRELSLEYARGLARGQTFGVKGLPDAFKRPQHLALAYFEASLVVEHLVELNGDQGLRTLLLAYADGASDADAFAKAFGRTVDDVHASFNGFVEKRYAALRDAMKDPSTPAKDDNLAALKAAAGASPGSFIAQYSLGQALFRAGDYAAARAPLEKAADLAPPASGPASPRALLAQIAEKEGDTARARRELRALLTHDHTNVAAARQLASLSADAPEDHDFALRLVADLDPFDAGVHGQLGRRLVAKSQFGEALVEFQAALALGPANVAEVHTDMAEALLKLGRRDDAKRSALSALKEAPTYARAQDLLLAAIGK